MFEGEAKRKGISFNVYSHPGLPTAVVGDQRRIRQVISNLISNAMQHTSTGGVTVEVWRAPVQPDNGDVMIEMVVVDTGSGMSRSTLEALFQQLEQVGTMDEEEGQHSLPSLEGQEKRILGLGLDPRTARRAIEGGQRQSFQNVVAVPRSGRCSSDACRQ